VRPVEAPQVAAPALISKPVSAAPVVKAESVPAAIAAPQPAPAAATGATLAGKVLETMNSGGYTYIKLRTASGDVWAAVQQTKVAVGEKTAIAPQMTLDDFESKTLNRKFDRIIFGVAAGGAAPVSVARAEGTNGKTIAEIWAGRETLKDAPVIVRGKVVKFLPGIMGKNWLHLRDGSGSHDNGSDDITVTTADRAAVGDVVLVSGTLRIDKDFGAGYRYPVIVEEAKVSK
jgi:hypothetical protein